MSLENAETTQASSLTRPGVTESTVVDAQAKALNGSCQEAIAAFARCIYEPDDIVEVRRLPSKRSTWHRASELAGQAEALTADNATDSIYVGANPRREAGGTKAEDVALARCQFVDFDDCTLDEAQFALRDADLPAPTVLFESGHGIHAWWRLAEAELDLDAWTRRQKSLIARLNTDKAIHDAPRIMRLPGFANRKPDKPVAPTRLVSAEPGRTYDVAEFELAEASPAALPTSEQVLPDVIHDGEGRYTAMFKLACSARSRNVSYENALALCQAENAKKCRPPKLALDVTKIVRDVYERYPAGHHFSQAELTMPAELAVSAEPILVGAESVTPKAIDWLWPGRLALGKLSLIVGDPGLCKSTLTLDIAARVSTGRSWPDLFQRENPAGGVIVISAEDDAEDTIIPRLLAHQADLHRIKLLQAKRFGDREAAFSLADADVLEEAIRRTPNCRLVVVDPISAYMPDLDSHKNADVRGVLAPLASLATTAHVSILCVSHLNKNSAVRAAYRTSGSLAFVAAARAVWLAVVDAEQPTRCLFLAVKNNLAPCNNGMAYGVESWLGDGLNVPRICWSSDVIRQTADEAFEALGRQNDKRRERSKPADAWLTGRLADGPQPVSVLMKMANDDGVSWTAIKRAKQRLGVESTRTGGAGGNGAWTWRLAGDDDGLNEADERQSYLDGRQDLPPTTT